VTDPAHKGEDPLERPVAIPVMGVVNVLAGSAGGCLGAITFVLGASGLYMQLLEQDERMLELSGAALFISALVLLKNALLLTSGVGLLMSRRWGRLLMVGYGWWGLVEVVSNLIFGRWMTLGLLELEDVAVEVHVGMLFVLSALGAVFPSLQLVVGYLPSVRRFFDAQATLPMERSATD
jgi:hypothetical protein